MVKKEKIENPRRRDFRLGDGTPVAYYPNSDIPMYEVPMTPLSPDCGYGFMKRNLINLTRKRSGLCSIVNEDALHNRVGSSAMIDYINAEQLHGSMDKYFMYGSVNAVRSRIRKVEELTVDLAKGSFEKRGEVSIYEAGCGFIRLPLNILDSLGGELYNLNLSYVGVDKNPDVVKVASKISEFRGASDKIRVYKGDALEELCKLNGELDMILVEGAMEYWSPEYRESFLEESGKHLSEDGVLVGTSTQTIPKEGIARFLGFYFPPTSQEDFIDTFTNAGFNEPKLIKTEPPNISIGIGMKKNPAYRLSD